MAVSAATLKKPQTAYWLWLGDNRENIAKTIGKSKGSDVAKKAGEMWKTLSDAAKLPYENKAKAEKEKYEQLISSTEGKAALEEKKAAKAEAKTEKGKKAEKKALKSVVKDDALKKPVSAYWMWLGDNREQIGSTIGTNKPTEIAKKAGEMWKLLSETAKAPYEKKAKEQKEAYDKYIASGEGAEKLKAFKEAQKEAKDQFKPKDNEQKRKAKEVDDDEGAADEDAAPAAKKARGRPPKARAAELGA
jgi:hypothetical protein